MVGKNEKDKKGCVGVDVIVCVCVLGGLAPARMKHPKGVTNGVGGARGHVRGGSSCRVQERSAAEEALEPEAVLPLTELGAWVAVVNGRRRDVEVADHRTVAPGRLESSHAPLEGLIRRE